MHVTSAMRGITVHWTAITVTRGQSSAINVVTMDTRPTTIIISMKITRRQASPRAASGTMSVSDCFNDPQETISFVDNNMFLNYDLC